MNTKRENLLIDNLEKVMKEKVVFLPSFISSLVGLLILLTSYYTYSDKIDNIFISFFIFLFIFSIAMFLTRYLLILFVLLNREEKETVLGKISLLWGLKLISLIHHISYISFFIIVFFFDYKYISLYFMLYLGLFIFFRFIVTVINAVSILPEGDISSFSNFFNSISDAKEVMNKEEIKQKEDNINKDEKDNIK